MGVFRHPPPTFIGGAQPYAPPRKVILPADELPVGFVVFRSIAILSAVVASWQPTPAYPQQSRHVLAPEGAQISVPAVRPWLGGVIASWDDVPAHPQQQRHAVAPENAQPSVRPWLSAVADSWQSSPPEIQQARRYALAVDQYEPQPATRPWLVGVVASWEPPLVHIQVRPRVTPPAGVTTEPPVHRSGLAWWSQGLPYQIQQQRKANPSAVATNRKALLITGPHLGLTNTGNLLLFGSGSRITPESASQFDCTENATFSGLAWRSTGGSSGTNTLRFRNNGANGNQVATRSGPGFAEDTTNSDALSVGDLFNLSFAETGSDASPFPFASCNVAFTDFHGNFHASASPSPAGNFNDPATKYIPFSGQLWSGGGLALANAQWKNRGYTSVESIQVRVLTNDRLNTTTFALNINGSNVGTSISVGAGVTGFFKVTGMGEALADGDLVCIQRASGAGADDLLVSFVGATFKSTLGQSETWAHIHPTAAFARPASATPDYCSPGGSLDPSATEADVSIKVGFPARIKNLRTFVESNSYSGSCTLKLFVNGSAVLTKTITAAATGWQENVVDGIVVDAGDGVSLEIVGGTSGTAAFRSAGFTFDQVESNEVVPVFRAPVVQSFPPFHYQEQRRVITPPVPAEPPEDAAPFVRPWLANVLSSWERYDPFLKEQAQVTPPAGVAGVDALPFARPWLHAALASWGEPSFVPGGSSGDTISEPVVVEGVDASLFKQEWLASVLGSWERDDRFLPERAKITPPAPAVAPNAPSSPHYPFATISDHWYLPEIPEHRRTRITPPAPAVAPNAPPFQPYPIGAIREWEPGPNPHYTRTRVTPPEGIPPVVLPPGQEPEPLVTSSGGKRKLPKKRRATIARHFEVLKARPVDLSREMEIARRNLLEIEALDQLLNVQDQLLLERYREIYLQYVLMQDDETIIMLAG